MTVKHFMKGTEQEKKEKLEQENMQNLTQKEKEQAEYKLSQVTLNNKQFAVYVIGVKDDGTP